MDVEKTVLGEESKAVTRWAWSVIPLGKQNGKNNHTWSEMQVFILLYTQILSELLRQGEQCFCFLIHAWRTSVKKSYKLQTLHFFLTKQSLTVYYNKAITPTKHWIQRWWHQDYLITIVNFELFIWEQIIWCIARSYRARSFAGWQDLGGMASEVTSTKNGLYVEWEEEKKNPQIIGIMCSMVFKHTHPDRLIDEPNESPKIKGGK